MKNRFFNRGVYLDTLKRLKLVGIIMAVISVLPSLLMAFSLYMEKTNTVISTATFDEMGSSPNVIVYPTTQVSPALEQAVPGLYIFMFIGALLLVYTAFSFLNKRNGSDFFHSMPCTRNCAYMSMGAAVISVIFATVTLSVLVTWLAYTVFGLVFIAGYVPLLIAAFFAGSTLVAAAATIAVCLTGTRLTNVTLTGIILFLPRMIIYIFTSLIMTAYPVLVEQSFGWFMSIGINIPVSAFISSGTTILFGWQSYLNYTSALYTIILAIIYIILGGIAFGRRKSETAAKSAPSKLLQHVYRCLITLPVMLIFLFARGRENNTVTVVIFAAASLVVYFLYEIITTKTAKKLLRTLPAYGILIVFTALFGISANLSGNAMSSYVPDANDVGSISLTADAASYYYSGGQQPSFNSLALKDAKLVNTRANELVVGALREGLPNGTGEYGLYHSRQVVTLNLKNGSKVTRAIAITNRGYNEFGQILSSDQKFTAALKKLPSDDETVSVTFGGNLSEADNKELWKMFKEEAVTLPYPEFAATSANDMDLFMEHVSANWMNVTEIQVTGNVGRDRFDQRYILTTFTPKTLKAFTDKMNAKYKGSFNSNNKGFVDNPAKYQTVSFDILLWAPEELQINNQKIEGNMGCYFTTRADGEATEDPNGTQGKLFDAISKLPAGSVAPTEYFMQVSVSYWMEGGDPIASDANPTSSQATVYIPLTKAQATELGQWMDEINSGYNEKEGPVA